MKEIGYRENVKAKESVDTVARTTQTLTIKASGNQIWDTEPVSSVLKMETLLRVNL